MLPEYYCESTIVDRDTGRFNGFIEHASGMPSMEYWERAGEIKEIRKGQIIYRYDEVPDSCSMIRKGSVIGYEEMPNGNELIYFLMGKGSFVMEANMLLKKPAFVNIRAEVPTEVIQISRQVLLDTLDRNPEMWQFFYASAAGKFLDAMNELRAQRIHSAGWRLCNVLLEFGNKYGVAYDNKVIINRRLSLQMFAGFMGVNRATAVRGMRELREMGLIEIINGLYCIRSLEQLEIHRDMLE